MSLRHAMRQNFAASFVAMGALIVVTPAWDHLTELVAALGLLQVEPSKPDRVAGALSGYLAKQEHTTHTKQLQLLHADFRRWWRWARMPGTPIAMRCSTDKDVPGTCVGDRIRGPCRLPSHLRRLE
jgi:hypothetical protein